MKDLKEIYMKDGLRFLRTTEHDGKIVALLADENVLGEGGVKSLQSAFNAHAKPLIRQGVTMLTKEQLQERMPKLVEAGLEKSAEAFRTALVRIDQRVNGVKPEPARVQLPRNKMN